MILLVTNKFDLSIDYVVQELRKREINFARLNAEDLPSSPCIVSFPKSTFRLHCDGGSIDICKAKLRSVFFRRPGKPFEWSELDGMTASFCADQWGGILQGLLSLRNVNWVNHPLSDRLAESKIAQLQKASDIGFLIPSTCITNDKATALEFLASSGGKAIAKALETPLLVDDDHEFFIYSNLIESLDASEESFRMSPTIFQEYIAAKTDIRVTVVGNKIFAVKILDKDKQSIPGDWRTVERELEFRNIDLPESVSQMCRNLLHEFGLIFGAIDILQKNDEYYFLEINPRGEWGWLQSKAGLPIAQAIVDELAIPAIDSSRKRRR